MNILVVRFRQMGDAILATSLLNTLRHNFPEAQIHFVLNEKIAPLFEGHPSIDRIITFTEEERHHLINYLKRVWQIVHQTHYDVIIDMRSTANTMLFARFSPHTPYRIGVKKGYTRWAFNHMIPPCGSKSMVEHDVSFASPLNAIQPIQPVKEFTLHITDEEKQSFGDYLQKQGINLSKPIMLANVTAKLASKVWDDDRMTNSSNNTPTFRFFSTTPQDKRKPMPSVSMRNWANPNKCSSMYRRVHPENWWRWAIS